MKRIYAVLFSTLVFFGCEKSPDLQEGIWRATLKTESGAEVPFNFELRDSAGTKNIYLLNGRERLKANQLQIEGDSVFIEMPLFETEIRAKLTSSGLKGQWLKHLADRVVKMPFNAQPNASWRFFKKKTPARYSVAGRWSAIFSSTDGKDTTIAIGEFAQNDEEVTGTFLTATGDYRFLQGSINGDKLFLSAFDGSSAYLFSGILQNDSVITDGLFYSGLNSVKNWSANRDEQAMLPDAYSLTTLKAGHDTLHFSFPDLNGNPVSLSDDRFKNKVVILQFLGSWCPNCMDETAFLVPFYQKYNPRGVEIIGLAYERTNDTAQSRKILTKFRERFNVNYPILITGFTNKEVLHSMPALNDFKAFPTTILIDKKGRVRNIHTGFSGPGTGEHYNAFIEDFEKQVKQLLNEP